MELSSISIPEMQTASAGISSQPYCFNIQRIDHITQSTNVASAKNSLKPFNTVLILRFCVPNEKYAIPEQTSSSVISIGKSNPRMLAIDNIPTPITLSRTNARMVVQTIAQHTMVYPFIRSLIVLPLSCQQKFWISDNPACKLLRKLYVSGCSAFIVSSFQIKRP